MWDKFSKHALVDHGLVVEHPKAKMELEKNIKRKLESLPLPRKKIKLTGRVGAASEAWKFSSNIKITEKNLKDLTENEISGVPLSSADKNSSEALFLKANAKKENETQLRHSKENILANIETNISISNNTEYVTYNHQEQIRSKHTDLVKSSQTGNVTVFSKIIPQFSSFSLSSRLPKNGSHTITCLDLLSLERTITASELTKIKKYDKNFKTGWLHDEIINSFFYQLTNRNEELLSCDSTPALVISEGKSFRKLWKDQDISKKSMIIIPFNPNNCHWILVVVSIKERTIAVMDPLVKNAMWTNAFVRKGVEAGLEIMRLKFNVQAQDMTKINITHVKQPDAINCGAMVCYYAEKIISGNIFWLLYVAQFRGVFRA